MIDYFLNSKVLCLFQTISNFCVFRIGMSKFYFLALGQGMEDDAKTYIERGAIRGHWVML